MRVTEWTEKKVLYLDFFEEMAININREDLKKMYYFADLGPLWQCLKVVFDLNLE